MSKMSAEEILDGVNEHDKDDNLLALLKGTSSLRYNGCDEDGWDLHEEQTRNEFEDYAKRLGYSVKRNNLLEWFYADDRTQQAWLFYHIGHVQGRTWNS